MKPFLFAVLLVATTATSYAQTKVFKEVSEDVSSDMKIITQDNALVGYLVFTQLEKASEDSFNYKVSVLDENLNDIGSVSFKEAGLKLMSVAFEQDVLCLAYIKSTIKKEQSTNKKKTKQTEVSNSIFTQFLSLEGKVIKTNDELVEMQSDSWENFGDRKRDFVYSGDLSQDIQLSNLHQLGFVMLVGDNLDRRIVTYDFNGNELWRDEDIPSGESFYLLTSYNDVYLLHKGLGHNSKGNYVLSSFDAKNGKKYDDINIKDNRVNPLQISGIGNDPVTGNLYITGNIVNSNFARLATPKDLMQGPYIGLFTFDINGHTKDQIKKTFTYWNNGSKFPDISERGYLYPAKSYMLLTGGYRDYDGNTYFIGSEYVKKLKTGTIISSGVFIAAGFTPVVGPGSTVLGLTILAIGGTQKWKMGNAALLKMTPKGNLSFENSIPCTNSRYTKGNHSLSEISYGRYYFHIDNPDTKNSYIILTDLNDIKIYNTEKKSVVRTIHQKEGNARTIVLPAKEGHIMVVEMNRKEKYTRLSIESLN